jgi:hypothetical protein
MGILSFLPLVGKVLDSIFPDKQQAEKAKLALLELQQKGDLAELEAELKLNLAQIEVNKEDSKSEYCFRSMYRPAAAWVGVLALLWVCFLAPVTQFILNLNHLEVQMPRIESDILFNVIIGLLGIGGMRTFEKMKGCNKIDQ